MILMVVCVRVYQRVHLCKNINAVLMRLRMPKHYNVSVYSYMLYGIIFSGLCVWVCARAQDSFAYRRTRK